MRSFPLRNSAILCSEAEGLGEAFFEETAPPWPLFGGFLVAAFFFGVVIVGHPYLAGTLVLFLFPASVVELVKQLAEFHFDQGFPILGCYFHVTWHR